MTAGLAGTGICAALALASLPAAAAMRSPATPAAAGQTMGYGSNYLAIKPSGKAGTVVQ
jgi:hypothetical protein